MNIPKVTPGKESGVKFGGKLQTIDHFKTFENNKATIEVSGQGADHQAMISTNAGINTHLIKSYDFRQNPGASMANQLKMPIKPADISTLSEGDESQNE